MTVATLQELLEAGVHFGHQVHRWNPKMKRFIWGERNGIYIIDLTKTSHMLDTAYEFLKSASAKGKKIVFVGTKKQAAYIVEEEAKRCGAFFINRRWLGGTLTNFETIRTRINKLRELEEMRDSGLFERLGKKEAAVLGRQLEKLDRMLGGVKEMRGMPDVIFVVDQKRELIAIQEAKKIGVPVVAIVDTNCDPEGIEYVIPGNDDASRAIKLIAAKMADAILAGTAEREARKAKGAAEAESGEALPTVSEAEMAAGKKPDKKSAEKSEEATTPAERVEVTAGADE